MAFYGQKNYQNLQGGGNGGKPAKYRISQIGCFVTAFCNLLQVAKKQNITPAQLNSWFTSHKTYIDVDDGVKDDLGWSSIRAYAPDIGVTAKSGIPNSSTYAIVRLKIRTGYHFCLVYKTDGKTVYVIDSWDGVVKKSSAIGTIDGWALYTVSKAAPKPVPKAVKPQPVQPLYYKVKKGDTLSAIAGRFKTSVANLLKLNPKIKNPNVIYTSDTLRYK